MTLGSVGGSLSESICVVSCLSFCLEEGSGSGQGNKGTNICSPPHSQLGVLGVENGNARGVRTTSAFVPLPPSAVKSFSRSRVLLHLWPSGRDRKDPSPSRSGFGRLMVRRSRNRVRSGMVAGCRSQFRRVARIRYRTAIRVEVRNR